MAIDVKVRFRSYLPGAGRDSSGNPSQRKQEVRGVIDLTSYTRGGEPLTPTDLGLTSIDWLDIKVADAVKSPDPTEGRQSAHFSNSAQEFYLVHTTAAGAEAESAGATAATLWFNAFGDSAHGPPLR